MQRTARQAFQACEFLMDYLKTQAPFWKKEGTAGRRTLGRCTCRRRCRARALGLSIQQRRMSGALPWITIFAVALGAAIGAVLRWFAAAWLNPLWVGFPLGTLAVNCAGGFMIGVALIGFEQWPYAVPRAFFITGFLGGLTTFSAFSGESLELLERGQITLSLLHTAAHVIGALACTALGFTIARSVLRT